MKNFKYLFVFIFLLPFLSCDKDDAKKILDTLNDNLSNEEIIEGLKSALVVGTDTSVTTVSAVNGYYKDEAIKILMPEEANIILDNKDDINSVAKLLFLGDNFIDGLIEDLVLRINRSAEDAAVKAKPIFVKSITSMSIDDAVNILHGEENAATAYLKTNTFDSLTNAFAPDINASLDKPIGVKGISANEAWHTLTTEYNKIANNFLASAFGLEPIQETELGTYVTHKALDGLFMKVEKEEKDIRTDVNSRVNDILQKVFGELDKE